MITTYEDYELSLERLAAFLEHPPAPGSEDERIFAQLVSAIDHYQPAAPDAARHDPGVRDEAAALVSRASALIEAGRERALGGKYSTYPEDGRGIGPTTGAP